jgi:hypothetical protein
MCIEWNREKQIDSVPSLFEYFWFEYTEWMCFRIEDVFVERNVLRRREQQIQIFQCLCEEKTLLGVVFCGGFLRDITEPRITERSFTIRINRLRNQNDTKNKE